VRHLPGVTVLSFVISISLLAASARAAKREDLGRSDKYRVLVDKVLMASNGWVMTEDHVRQIADAGFNVVCPRIGGDDMARVRRVAELAQKHGIYYMAWMRGTLAATSGTRLVWANGLVQDLYSPNSDELWAWMTEKILGQARISVEVPSIVGVFLDYENYASGRQGNCYALSYDDKILGEFARSRHIDLPQLAPAERYPWLIQRGLHDEFAKFQIRLWRARCRRLRQQVDAINPRFQFIVYPAPGTLFITEAVYPEWATKQAPLILADACTYGRPGGLIVPHQAALRGNRGLLQASMDSARASGVPLLYMGGIDPLVDGADPEFCGKNAVMISDISDGYWIFYEGPTYGKPDHEAYWRWFTRANREIAAGRYGMQYEPRETPDTFEGAEIERKTDKLQVGLYGMKPRMHDLVAAAGKYEVHELRGMSLEYLRQFDVVVLQNFNLPLAQDHPFVRALREYVDQGGGLFLVHDTGWFMPSPFPDIATRDRPRRNVEAERHVVGTDLAVAAAHAALGGVAPGTRFTPEFRDHMIFKAGPQGEVVIRNGFGDPVYVVGERGKGRVAYSGSYYGYSRDLDGPERQVFLAILDWLAG
jgi:hypothetical protein